VHIPELSQEEEEIEMLRLKTGCFVLVILFSLFLGFPVCAATDPYIVKQLEILRNRIDELEKEIKAGEQERKKLEEANKELQDIKDKLSHLSISGGVTTIFQGTVNNGDNCHEGDVQDGNYSIDLNIEANLEKWGTGFIHLEAGDGDSVTDEVPALTGINADVLGEQNDVEVAEAWWEFHPPQYEALTFTIGKLDPTVYWDANNVANDETTQFMADIFVNNVAMEWPDYTPGFRLMISPNELVDINLGLLSADSDWENLFEDVFGIMEFDIKPRFLQDLAGNYRFYVWINGIDHVEWDDVKAGITHDDKENYGFGFSFDQQCTEDITVFSRFGIQDSDIAGVSPDGGELEPFAMECSWSLGGQITGQRWNRPDDVFAIAVGQAILSDDFEDYLRDQGIDPGDETHLELYYSIALNNHVAISPDFQLIDNLGGDEDADTAYIFGVRTQVNF